MRADELDLVTSHLEDGIAIIETGGRVVRASSTLLTAFGTRPQTFEQVPEPHERNGQAHHPDPVRLVRWVPGVKK